MGLKDHGTNFEINVMDDILQSYEIIKIGDDFIVLEVVANVTQTTIPVYSVKAIVRWKFK